MKRILFVDDEQHVLDGLRDLLRGYRRQWDMVFAAGGTVALEEMAKAPFDVVVSDMRMPGMDGAALLQKVRELYPGTARIVLSGHAEQDLVLKALPVSHQFLSKPCAAETLREVIDRACGLRALLTDSALRALVGKIETLPSAPSIYWELTRALANENSGMAEVGGIVERDPALCAKLLQIVNSAFFGLPQHVSSVGRAISYLGLELVKSLAITSQLSSVAERIPPIPGFSIEELQHTALLVAEVAKQIVRDPTQRDGAFTAGLLHDVGKIILALGVRDRFAEVYRLAAAPPERPLHVVEKEALGVSHAEVGAFLLGTWGLPLPLVTAVAYHHAPAAAAPGNVDLIIAVHVADALVAETVTARGARPGLLDLEALEAFGVAGELPGWRTIAERVVHRRMGTR